MIPFRRSPQYRRDYAALSPRERESADRLEELIRSNPAAGQYLAHDAERRPILAVFGRGIYVAYRIALVPAGAVIWLVRIGRWQPRDEV